MKSKYYCLARFKFSHSLQIGKKFFVGSPLYCVSKLLGILCLLHNTTKTIDAMKHLKLSLLASRAAEHQRTARTQARLESQ